MFDATLSVADMKIGVEEGANHLEIMVTLGIGIPTPQGIMPLPAGVLRIPLDRNQSEQLSKALAEASTQLAEPAKQSDIIIAGNMAQADRAAKINQSVRG